MTNREVKTSLSMEQGNIDRDRIVDGHLVPDELFCPICDQLLWKPRACASCQHLFCGKCIRMWLENVNSANKCPFRCQPFEERRSPPYVQSLLSRLNIRCRNSSFGCTQILSYDALQHHENVECKYLSKRCLDCDKMVLPAKFDEHRQFPELCVPPPIKCTICQNYIERSEFRDHFHLCCQNKAAELTATVAPHENDQPVQQNDGMTVLEYYANTNELYEQQRQMSRLPTSLKGIDDVRRAREEGCGFLYRILVMLKLNLLNWTKIPFFLLIFLVTAFTVVGLPIFGLYIIFSNWTYINIYRGSFVIILISYFLNYGTSIFLQFVSDTTIILCHIIFLFLYGCSIPTTLEVLEMNPMFNKPGLCIGTFSAGILIVKLTLFFVRLYYWYIPAYVTAGLFALINIYLVFKAHPFYEKVEQQQQQRQQHINQ